MQRNTIDSFEILFSCPVNSIHIANIKSKQIKGIALIQIQSILIIIPNKGSFTGEQKFTTIWDPFKRRASIKSNSIDCSGHDSCFLLPLFFSRLPSRGRARQTIILYGELAYTGFVRIRFLGCLGLGQEINESLPTLLRRRIVRERSRGLFTFVVWVVNTSHIWPTRKVSTLWIPLGNISSVRIIP